jgi:hypothetical protein
VARAAVERHPARHQGHPTLLKYLPGGSKIVKWTEASPYLLTLVLVTHGAVSATSTSSSSAATACDLADRAAAATRSPPAPAQRMQRSPTASPPRHDQLERVRTWLDRQAPSAKVLEQWSGRRRTRCRRSAERRRSYCGANPSTAPPPTPHHSPRAAGRGACRSRCRRGRRPR